MGAGDAGLRAYPVDAAGVADEELRLAGFTAELARRAFLAGDGTLLGELDANDPAVAHYRALLAYRRKRDTAGMAAIRPADRQLVGALDALREAGPDGRRTVPADIAGDPSTWTLLRDYAYRGELSIEDDVRRDCPAFAAWLDLCRTQRLVFEARWDAVVLSGRSLLTSTASEALQDEAQNMMAFAEWQLGHPDEALRVLDQALAGQFTNGLVVNAALVAAQLGCLRAFPYLDRALRLATDPRVRQGAVTRAIACWVADPTVTEYPQALAGIVREALRTPQTDDTFFHELVQLSFFQDRQWLAGREAERSVRAADDGQRDVLGYFVLKARAILEEYPERLVDLARRLILLWRRVRARPGRSAR